MKYECAVPTCRRTLESGILFFPFPSNDPMRNIWLDKLRLRAVSPTQPLKICATHFQESDFYPGTRTLTSVAVPSRNLNMEKRFAINGSKIYHPPVTKKPKPARPRTHLPVIPPPPPLPRNKPCRRAAMIAAERITNNVPQLEDEEEEEEKKPVVDSKKRTRSQEDDDDYDFDAEAYPVRRRRYTPIDPQPQMWEPEVTMSILPMTEFLPEKPCIVHESSRMINNLIMECSEDVLSKVQTLHLSQLCKEFASHKEKIARFQTLQTTTLTEIYAIARPELHSPPPSPPPTPPPPEVDIKDPEPEPSSYILPPPRIYKPHPTLIADPSHPYRIVVNKEGAVIGVLSKYVPPDNLDLERLVELIDKERQEREQEVDYQCLLTIKGGTQHTGAKTLLSLRVEPTGYQADPPTTIRAFQQWLKDEGLFNKPLHWMWRKGLLKMECQKCSICNSQLSLEPDCNNLDGYSWKCLFPKCSLVYPINRPKFFVRFVLSMERLLRVCCQWALQLGPGKADEVHAVQTVFRSLQELCGWALEQNLTEPLPGPVEVGAARLGHFWVLGAYDRKLRMARLRAVASLSPPEVSRLVSSWVSPSATIVTEQSQLATLSAYLSNHLTSIFGSLALSQLTLRDIQGLLNELQWREFFGTTGLTAFWNIFHHIAHFSNCQVDMGPHLLREEEESICSSSEPEEEEEDADAKEEVGRRKGRKVPQCSDCKYPDVPTVLEEFYYAKMNPLKPPPPQRAKLPTPTYQCHECKATIPKSVQMMGHYRAHMDHQLNPHLVQLTRCMWCYKSFSSPYTQQFHLEKHHLREEGRFHCRICLVAFSSTKELLQHMTTHHHRHDMPYICQVCGFRSSFHKDIVEHFAEEHDEHNHLLCQFCLRVYTPKISAAGLGITRSYLQHMATHCNSPDSHRCTRCALVFPTDHALRLHRRSDHYYHPPPSADVIPYSSPHPPDKAIMVPAREPLIDEETSSPGLVLDLKEDILCLECHEKADQDHFRTRVHCDRCFYTSHCLKAFVDHMVCLHGGRKPRQFLNLLKLQSPGSCPCGFQTHLGNDLAEHLISCRKAFALLGRPDLRKSVKATKAFLESLMDTSLDQELGS